METSIDLGESVIELVDVSRDQENPQLATAAGDQERGNPQIASTGPAHSALEDIEEQPCPGDAERAHSESSDHNMPCRTPPPNAPADITSATWAPGTTPDPHSSRRNVLEGKPPTRTAVTSELAHDLSLWPPLVMTSCFLLGLVASISHHLFYSHLNDTIAYENDQLWNLRSACVITVQVRVTDSRPRAGTAFAWVVKTFLDACVWQAYAQWLWTAFKKHYISMRVLDSALRVQNSLLDLRNVLFSKARVGALLAVMAW
jgi:hypothetical protein